MSELLARVKIPFKIMALLVILGVVTLGVAFIGSRSISNTDAEYSTVVETKLPVTTRLARTNRQVVTMVYAGYRALAYNGGTRETAAAVEAEAKAYQAALTLLDEVTKMDPSIAEDAAKLRVQVDKVHSFTGRAAELGDRNENDAARALLVQADSEVEALSAAFSALNADRIAKATELSNTLSANASSNATTMLVLSVVATLGCLVLAFFVSRAGITTPLSRLEEAMRGLAAGNNRTEVPGTERADEVGEMAKALLVFRENAIAQEAAQKDKARAEAEQQMVVQELEQGLSKLADGDLTAKITAQFSATYVSVKDNFNRAVEALRDLISAVSESTASIRTGSTEIAHASEDLARRTEANAASLEETSAAVTQMDQRLKNTAMAAGRTVERADGAISTVTTGRTIADEAVQAMTRVSESAKGIDSVIEGLDKIAFQTRVLAMNAAVEAGRAGEAGRGFAVVADLVSALAMRSEEEASRARDQLTATQTDIVAAVGMVQKVDASLADISSDVSEVHQLLAQMAADNQAQSSAISQVSTAISQMDHSTQQNAAMVEETSAAARNLNSEVNTLAEQASRFVVGDTAHAPPARNPAPRPVAAAAPAPRAARLAAAKSDGYVSPVKALPAPAGGSAPKAVAQDDWTAF